MTDLATLASSLRAELGGMVSKQSNADWLRQHLPEMTDGALADCYFNDQMLLPDDTEGMALLRAEIDKRKLTKDDLIVAHEGLRQGNAAKQRADMIEQLAKMVVRLKGYVETANVTDLGGYTGPAWQHPDALAKAESAFGLLSAVDATPNL